LNTSELIKDLAKVKRKQTPLWEHLRQERHALAHRVRSCGSYLELREWLDHDGQCTVQSANFCKKATLCNMCAIRRAAKLTKAYESRISQVMQQPGNEHLTPVMITITIKNREDFAEGFNHLKQSFTKLMKKASDYKRRKNKLGAPPEMAKVRGGVYSYEFKIGKGGKWHPHLHMFALLDCYIDQPAFSREWLEITGDSFVVGVTECKGGILPGLIEVLKYSTKFSDMTPAQTVEVYEKTKGRTLVSPVGILRGVSVEDLDSDEQLDGDFIDYVAIYLYQKNGYRLKLKRDLHEDDEVSEEVQKRLKEEREVLRRDKSG
jgi:hypothetical protein